MELTCASCARGRLSALTTSALDGFLGKNISEICDIGYTDNNLNHCAHFVSHVLNLKIGMICGAIKWESRHKGVSIRVDEIYNACADRGPWDERNAHGEPCLAFVTPQGNVTGAGMGRSPSKHIGICVGEYVYHYSNSGDKVVKDTPASFLLKFRGVYGSSTAMYYGELGGDML